MRSALLILALGLAQCGPNPDGDGGVRIDANVEPGLEIGQGFEVFAPVEPGATVDLVAGCQGSQHVWTALRAQGIDRRGTIVDLALIRDRDEEVVSQSFRVRVSMMEVPGETYVELTGLTLIVPTPDEALEEELTLRATVTDNDGIELVATTPVRIEWNEDAGCG